MQRDIIKELLAEKMKREQRLSELNDQLAARHASIEPTQPIAIRDSILLEQLTELNGQVEATKADVSQTHELIETGMSALLAKLDEVIGQVSERGAAAANHEQ